MTWLYENPIVEAISWVLGNIVELVYNALDFIGIANIGISIIFLTIIVRMFMLPMTIKQQKFTKLNSVMQPEIQAIQKKYKGKKDQQSQMEQQAEIKEVYAKYGTSPTGSCLQLLIQMPILFALYNVIRNLPNYITSLRTELDVFVGKLTEADINKYFDNGKNASKEELINAMMGATISKDVAQLKSKYTVVDLLNAFPKNGGSSIKKIMDFLGLNVGMSPYRCVKGAGIGVIIVAVTIPLLAGLFQFLSVHLNTKMNKVAQNTDSGMPGMQGSMKVMNFIMPIFSIFMCFSLATGLGIYWCVGSLIMMLQQIFINKHLNKIGLDTIIEQNKKKAAKKAERKKAKKGIYRENVLEAAQNKAKAKTDEGMSAAEKEAKIQKAKEAATKKQGSLASKANLVSEFNKKNDK